MVKYQSSWLGGLLGLPRWLICSNYSQHHWWDKGVNSHHWRPHYLIFIRGIYHREFSFIFFLLLIIICNLTLNACNHVDAVEIHHTPCGWNLRWLQRHSSDMFLPKVTERSMQLGNLDVINDKNLLLLDSFLNTEHVKTIKNLIHLVKVCCHIRA